MPTHFSEKHWQPWYWVKNGLSTKVMEYISLV